MKVFNSDLYGSLQEPESIDEIFSIIFNNQTKSFTNVFYWRGQSNIDWRIDSSGFRRILNTKIHGTDKERQLADYEFSLLEAATHKGYRHHDGRSLYDIELLARLQHHGAATRLIDFSRNVLVGLWFCIISNVDKYGILIGVSTDIVIGQENYVETRNYKTLMEYCKDHKKLMTFEPTNVSRRISAQHSQFLFSYVSDSGKSSLVLPKKDYQYNIAISPNLKIKLKQILESLFDIHTITMFPDIDGFGLANNQNISRWDMDRW